MAKKTLFRAVQGAPESQRADIERDLMGNKVTTIVKAHVYSSEDVHMCAKDMNSKRRIELKDVLHFMERNPRYTNSKVLHSALVSAVKNT